MKIFETNKIAISLLSPFFFTFAIYLHLNGEVSPGGGFGAGVLFASIFIIRHFCGVGEWFSHSFVNKISFGGICGYFAIALLSLLINGSFLDYSFISTIFNTPASLSQQIGIFAVETCILATVFASCYKIFLTFYQTTSFVDSF